MTVTPAVSEICSNVRSPCFFKFEAISNRVHSIGYILEEEKSDPRVSMAIDEMLKAHVWK